MKLLLAILALVLPLAVASSAGAVEQHTKWYSIVVKAADDSLPPLFLTNESDGVKLERYRSGDVTQQWTITQPDYPNFPAVTASGFDIGGFFKCIIEVFDGGCSFQGHAGMPVKIVNHASGGCLLLTKGGATTRPCDDQGADNARQRWLPFYTANQLTMGSFTPLVAGGGSTALCLTSDNDTRRSPDMHKVFGSSCGGKGGFAWSQLFTMQLAAELSCKTNWDFELCVVEGQGR